MRTRSLMPLGILILTVINTAFALVGLIANPSFATGDDITSVQVLGVEFNGWHALLGLIVFAPGFIVIWRPEFARVYAIAVIVALVPSGFMALVDDRPLGLIPFEQQMTEFVYHVGTAALYAALLVADWALRRRAAPAALAG